MTTIRSIAKFLLVTSSLISSAVAIFTAPVRLFVTSRDTVPQIACKQEVEIFKMATGSKIALCKAA